MKSPNIKTTCSSDCCQKCQGCQLRQSIKDAADDLDEWAMAMDAATAAKTEEYMSLDKAIEVSTLAG